jgi:hypothetical protein
MWNAHSYFAESVRILHFGQLEYLRTTQEDRIRSPPLCSPPMTGYNGKHLIFVDA